MSDARRKVKPDRRHGAHCTMDLSVAAEVTRRVSDPEIYLRHLRFMGYFPDYNWALMV